MNDLRARIKEETEKQQQQILECLGEKVVAEIPGKIISGIFETYNFFECMLSIRDEKELHFVPSRRLIDLRKRHDGQAPTVVIRPTSQIKDYKAKI